MSLGRVPGWPPGPTLAQTPLRLMSTQPVHRYVLHSLAPTANGCHLSALLFYHWAARACPWVPSKLTVTVHLFQVGAAFSSGEGLTG